MKIKKPYCCALGCRRESYVILVYVGGFSTPLCPIHHQMILDNKVIHYKKVHMEKHKSSKFFDIMM